MIYVMDVLMVFSTVMHIIFDPFSKILAISGITEICQVRFRRILKKLLLDFWRKNVFYRNLKRFSVMAFASLSKSQSIKRFIFNQMKLTIFRQCIISFVINVKGWHRTAITLLRSQSMLPISFPLLVVVWYDKGKFCNVWRKFGTSRIVLQ